MNMFDWRVDKLLELPRNRRIASKRIPDLRVPHCQELSVKKNILPPVSSFVKNRSRLQARESDTPIYLYFPRGRISDPWTKTLSRRALPRSVFAPIMPTPPFVRVERNIPQSPDGLLSFHATKRALDHPMQPLPESICRAWPVQPISLGEPLNLNAARHGS